MSGHEQIATALACLARGDKSGLDHLMPELYDQLRHVAAAFLAHERPDHTLQPTALVHEAYLRLVGQYNVDWSCRAQVLGLAANMMRRILVKHAQTRGAQKRDWGTRVPLDDALDLLEAGGELEIQQLDRALDRLPPGIGDPG